MKARAYRKLLLVLCAVTVLGCATIIGRSDQSDNASSAASGTSTVDSRPVPQPVFTSSLIVKLVPGLSTADQEAVILRNGGTQTSSVPALRLHTIEVSPDAINQI